jgi:hypothetical protein
MLLAQTYLVARLEEGRKPRALDLPDYRLYDFAALGESNLSPSAGRGISEFRNDLASVR